jgi:hypothetical protein
VRRRSRQAYSASDLLTPLQIRHVLFDLASCVFAAVSHESSSYHNGHVANSAF